ncbi:hypothetical protein OY671_007723, partial [Metschnikowia pulcherrima]
QESRCSGDTAAFSWRGGGFYTVEHASPDQTSIASGSSTGTPYVGTGPSTYREYAGFADSTWHATDKLDVSFGGRYAHKKQPNFTNSVLSSHVVGVFGSTGTISAKSDDNAFTWSISPSYHFTPDIMAYARVASGYRPGGPNIGSPPGAPASFGPDRVVNYEVGFKGKVVPGSSTIDTASFQIDWRDVQLQGTDPVTSSTFVANGGKARSRGIEFAASSTPWRGMTIDGNSTFTDATITQNISSLQGGAGFRGYAGDRSPFTAKVTASLSAQQNFDIAEKSEGNFGFASAYIGDRAAAFQTNSASATRPRISIPGYKVFDSRGGLVYDKDWSSSLYIRNSFDERGITAAQNRNGANVPTASFIQPRTFGITSARTF